MAKHIQKRIHMGYVLFINPTGTKGSKNWTKVGHLFNTSHEASEYRKHKFEHVKYWSVEGVRVNIEPVKFESDSK